jgi:hypothetical protein
VSRFGHVKVSRVTHGPWIRTMVWEGLRSGVLAVMGSSLRRCPLDPKGCSMRAVALSHWQTSGQLQQPNFGEFPSHVVGE